VEHPLQLPSAPQRRGRPTASIPTQHRRHQRPALLHLGGRSSQHPAAWTAMRPRVERGAEADYGRWYLIEPRPAPRRRTRPGETAASSFAGPAIMRTGGGRG
jgi:hypothetical protein